MQWLGRGLPFPPLAKSDVEGREMRKGVFMCWVLKDDDAASSLPDALGREATALASLFVFLNRRSDVLNRWCARNGFADARRWVRADDMVMSSLPRPKDGDAVPSLPDAAEAGDEAREPMSGLTGLA